MTDFNNYFIPNVKNTLQFKNGVNFLHKGPWIQIFDSTEIDRWYVGDFASASYQISLEFNSNKKETLQVLVVARPDYANYSIVGRVAIDDELVDVSVEVNDSYLSLKLSPKIADYNGLKAIYRAHYSGVLNAIERPQSPTFLVPDPTPGGPPISGGGSTINLGAVDRDIIPDLGFVHDLGTAAAPWDNLYLGGVLNLNGAVISSTGSNAIEVPAGSTIGGQAFTYFNKISVAGESDVVAETPNDRVTLVAGTGISIITDPLTDSITITNTGSSGSSSGGGGTVSSGNSFTTIAVSGQSNVIAERASDTLTFVAGTGMTITTNAASDTITFSSSGGGGGSGGTAQAVIVQAVSTGSYPLVLSTGTDSVSGQSLYAKSTVTLNTATDVLTVTSTQAQWADLAENYLADAAYEPGTVLEFGGDYEVTVASDETRRVAGIVSTQPAHLMNGHLEGKHVVPLALQGRVPCKVRGKIHKGDMMVASGGGYARPSSDPKVGTVIGKALENFDGVEGVIEVVVGRL